MLMIAASASIPHSGLLALHACWLAAILLILSVVYRRPKIFAGFQAALAGAVLFAVTAHWRHPLLDPWTLQAYGIALGLLSLCWAAARRWIKRAPDRFQLAEGLLNPPWPAADRVIAAGLVVLLTGLIARGVWPGIAAEFLPGQVAGLDFVQQHAAGWGAWVFLATLLAAFALQARPIWVIFFLAFLCCPLLAAAWTHLIAPWPPRCAGFAPAISSSRRSPSGAGACGPRPRRPAGFRALRRAGAAKLTLQRISAAAVGATPGGRCPLRSLRAWASRSRGGAADHSQRRASGLAPCGRLGPLMPGLRHHARRRDDRRLSPIRVLTPEPHFNGGQLIQLLELNVVTAMLFSMGWRALQKVGPSPPRGLYLQASTRVMEAICILGAARIFLAPGQLTHWSLKPAACWAAPRSWRPLSRGAASAAASAGTEFVVAV